MPEYKLKTSEVRGINTAVTVLLAAADLDILLSYRLSTVSVAIEGIIKASTKALQANDEKYVEKKDGKPVPLLDDDGKPSGGSRIREEDRVKWEEAKEKALDAVKGFTCPEIEMSDLLDAQNEDGVEIKGWIIHSLRPLLKVSAADLKKAGGDGKAKPEKTPKKPKGRAANVKAKKAKESEEE